MTAVTDSVIPDEVLDEVARRFSLLGDPTRLRVVRALHDVGECSVREVSELAGTTVANASQHLARLHEAGVVSRRRAGKSVRYVIVDPTIEDLCRTVCDRVRDRAASLSLVAPSGR